MEDAIKTGKDFCEEEQNDVKQSVADTSFYDEATGDMLNPNLVKEVEAEEQRRFCLMREHDVEDRQSCRI